MEKSHVLIDRLADLHRLAEEARYHPNEFAQLCGISLRSLERQCRERFGVTPHQLLNAARWRNAERLLSRKAVKEVFKDLGYNSMANLSRGFKRLSPGFTIKSWRAFRRREGSAVAREVIHILCREMITRKRCVRTASE